MVIPVNTAVFAGFFGLIYIGLTVWIMAARTVRGVLQGSGGDPGMEKRIRVHANFAEYVPLGLILIGLWEAAGGHVGPVKTALWLLLIGRILHPFGLFAPPNSAGQFAFRGGGMLLTLLSILLASIALLHAFL